MFLMSVLYLNRFIPVGFYGDLYPALVLLHPIHRHKVLDWYNWTTLRFRCLLHLPLTAKGKNGGSSILKDVYCFIHKTIPELIINLEYQTMSSYFEMFWKVAGGHNEQYI